MNWKSIKFAWENRGLLWVLKDLPALIQNAEKIFGPGHGPEKKALVISTFYDALVMAEKGTGREWVDEKRARKAASWLVDGTVEMFNAFGLWPENPHFGGGTTAYVKPTYGGINK